MIKFNYYFKLYGKINYNIKNNKNNVYDTKDIDNFINYKF